MADRYEAWREKKDARNELEGRGSRRGGGGGHGGSFGGHGGGHGGGYGGYGYNHYSKCYPKFNTYGSQQHNVRYLASGESHVICHSTHCHVSFPPKVLVLNSLGVI